MMNLKYRKDIDGLRAISVLSVLLTHAGIGLFSGGFIGVDVFFVISGYLITTILVKEIQSNEFSLIRFYERRIRRILPALFVVVAFTVAVCVVMYDAEKFMDFGKSVIATTLFVSNINFWKESGYFDAPSQLKPLLHTWSLAVEEQFYIFFPLFMFLLYRYAKKLAPFILAGTAVLSFGFAVHGTFTDPSAAFYLSHLRAWELLVGSMLAINIIPTGVGKKYSNIIGFVGLAMIAIPIFQYTESTKFPGISALAPVLGAALILFSGMEGKSLVGRFLSIPPLVFIGKISYSLYLWHWPLIIFVKYYMIRQLTPFEVGGLLVASILISALSWRFVETPFRSKSFISTRQIYALGAIGMVLMFFAGGTVYYFKGFPERQGLEYLAKDKKKEEVWLFKECNINYTDNPEAITPCEVGDRSQLPSFIIMGDSHTPTYGKAIHRSAEQSGVSGILSYDQGCPTLLDMIPNPEIGDVPCIEYNHMALSYLKEHPEINTVILASRWTIWVEGVRYKQEEGVKLHLTDSLGEAPPDASEEYLFTLGLERTIKAILELDRKVVVVAPLPEIGYDVPSANFIASRTRRDINELIAPSLDEYLTRTQKTFAILESFKEKYGIQVIEPWKTLCVEGKCRAAINDIPLYNDDDHLSIFGSELVTPVFDPLFELMKQSGE
jgi:peptidoglycan/LPS O-acetylase OafA/YrhL